MVSQIPKQTYPRPFLKWAGGKTRLISQYKDYFPQHYQTYYEPFLGGGAVFFHLQPSHAVLTDINADLVITYRCVRDNLEELITLLQAHQQRHNSEYYYDVRNYHNGTDLTKAARFIYLNKTCFNGLYRVNSQGKFNVPVGKYKNPGICQEEVLRVASLALQKVEIKQANFEEVLNYATGTNDFVYFDPPYYPLNKTSNFTAYSNFCFDENQQIKLRDIFIELADKGVKVMLSNSDCPLIRDLYSDFNVHTISAARSINSNAQKRGKITEVLVTSYRK
ncbi:MAG: DNA adenine methylase [Dolichospermum sp. DEX189]|jgi:DNA adenine methylase|uniref:Site-specific DNA-methyltransferase (adenine-specific) n=1 Tax=Aphanizomenon flos-aquae FACHB-1040 TaxID=2692887 RepID=A0ABR8BQ24_APHFL|nr:DNA adenine methylase [Aphanizomenon flos-aquae]MBD2276899.1 DNA adenine methylase [Aphanizomenon flos-aquae FACHB-1040]MBO1071493.1 DNA adenine methylase [Dolichospermum sp. DEX189]